MRPAGEVGLWPVVVQATGGSGVEPHHSPTPRPEVSVRLSSLVNKDLWGHGLRSSPRVGQTEQEGLGVQARTHPAKLSLRGNATEGTESLGHCLLAGDPQQLAS